MPIIGLVVVIVMVFGGYVISGGSMHTVLEAMPSEMMTILGGAVGALIIGNTPQTLKAVGAGIK